MLILLLGWHLNIAFAADDLLLDTGGDLSLDLDDASGSAKASPKTSNSTDAHAALFYEDKFPSASTCQTCHKKHFDQWSASPHAYAQMSVVSNSMAGTMLSRTGGTIGDFCYRCHNPVGMNLEEPLFMSSMDRHPTSREGITCVTCHRLDREYGKVGGRVAVVQGDITTPVYGPTGGDNLKKMRDNPEVRVTDDPDAKGRKIHSDAKKLSYMSKPGMCSICHDVTLSNGLRLEETFTEYKRSPAAQRGETCQDCHMGKEPGIASGYDFGPAAIVGGIQSPPRKLTNHSFAGPDYSLIHPGIFPHNPDAQKMASIREWITFNYKAGWGTDKFEDNVPKDYKFPDRWSSIDDRYDARKVIDLQLQRLETASANRKKILQKAYLIGDIKVNESNKEGLDFDVQFVNGTDGHNAPTGFERVVYFQITVTDATGKSVFKSGDLDPNGDLRDMHSAYVHNGELPLDGYLFNLQHKFITRNIRGGEREQVLASNFSVDPLPYVRPDSMPNVLLGRPLGARFHRKGVPTGQSRWANYHVDGDQLKGAQPPYKANIKLIAGMIPVNLVNEVKEVGFDFNMTPREVADNLVAGHQVLWERNIDLTQVKTYAKTEQ
ncbi:MAG: multiheme c-type cytochrome [Gammaproteobacteria bacterium]